MSRFVTEVAGAVAEAWQEVRIHRGRVLLSLIGVAVAVCALAASAAVSGIAQQSIIEQNESSGGRPAMLTMSAGPEDPSSLAASGSPGVTEAWFTVLERHEIHYASREAWDNRQVRFPTGNMDAQVRVVDQPYAEMHRVRILEGSWFAAGDGQRLVPAMVVNPAFWESLGSPDLSTHPVVTVPGLDGVDAVVIGVYASSIWDTMPSMYMLASSYPALADPVQAAQLGMQYKMWVPEDISAGLSGLIKGEMSAALGEGSFVSVDRMDYATYAGDPTAVFRIVTSVIAGIILVLGALGLLNIALVTVRQRIREIGIRRSFGATSGRVFFSVMMESVVATTVAGVIGVTAAVLIVSSPLVRDLVTQGMVSDLPPFPVDAAVLGLVSAVAVGALAGLVPASIALRVKVIDAIRF